MISHKEIEDRIQKFLEAEKAGDQATMARSFLGGWYTIAAFPMDKIDGLPAFSSGKLSHLKWCVIQIKDFLSEFFEEEFFRIPIQVYWQLQECRVRGSESRFNASERLRQLWDMLVQFNLEDLQKAQTTISDLSESQRGLVTTWGNIAQALIPWLIYFKSQRELRSIGELREELSKAHTQVKSDKKEYDSLVAMLRDQGLKKGITQRKNYFSDLAFRYEVLAMTWLGIGISIILSTIWWIHGEFLSEVGLEKFDALMLVLQSAGIEHSQYLILVSRMVIISFVSILIGISFKNHKANSHNAVINRHRSTALNSFEYFSNSTTDQATRSYILQKVAECSFAPASTGYDGSEERQPYSQVSQIIETIKGRE